MQFFWTTQYIQTTYGSLVPVYLFIALISGYEPSVDNGLGSGTKLFSNTDNITVSGWNFKSSFCIVGVVTVSGLCSKSDNVILLASHVYISLFEVCFHLLSCRDCM